MGSQLVIINELAQWAVLAFLAIFVLGLTRHLGAVLVSPREQAAASIGPDIGGKVPSELIKPAERERVQELVAASERGWGVLLLVDEECSACEMVIARLRDDGAPRGVPVVTIARRSEAEHRAELERLSDLVLVGNDRLGSTATIRTTPFIMIVDRGLRVKHKAVGTAISDAIREWKPAEGDATLTVIHQHENGAVPREVGTVR